MNSAVRLARNANGYTITEAAKLLRIPPGYLSEIETGKKQVSAKRAAEIAELYGVSEEQIFLVSRYTIREVHDSQHTAQEVS